MKRRYRKMSENPKLDAKHIADLCDEIKVYREAGRRLAYIAGLLEQNLKAGKITKEQYEKQKEALLKGKGIEEWKGYYNHYIEALLDEIGAGIGGISAAVGAKAEKPAVKVVTEKQISAAEKKIGSINKHTRELYLRQLGIDEELLEIFAVKRKKRALEEAVRVQYSLYKTHEFGMLANRIFEKTTVYLTTQYPELFQPLYRSLRMSGIKVLSKTYISIILLSSSIAFLAVMLLTSLLYPHPFIPLQALRGLMFGLIAAMITGAIMYFYPQSVASERDGKIKSEIPFAIVHMSAVAGSGAKPISMFKTILTSDEYPNLKDEVKKIVNYVTIFGYDLPTAMKTVARTTPSIRFKDLLDGIVNNIETGGDLKEYLTAIADEALGTYKIERQKEVHMIETYSDVYTSLLIAAPLLFFSTLAIIQTIGGEIGGLSAGTIAIIGTYVGIPVLNVGFMVFLKMAGPK